MIRSILIIAAFTLFSFSASAEERELQTAWMGGGSNPIEQCNRLATQAFPGRAYDIVETREDSRRTGTFNTHVEYKYWCKIKLK